jgi:hypothetical protein
LQSFFTGGGAAREHAEYPLANVTLLAPVLHPPSIRLFDDQHSFAFANPAAVVGPGGVVAAPRDTVSRAPLAVVPRVAAVIGAHGALAGFTGLAEWRAPWLEPPKDRDFALGLGPLVLTPDELDAGRAGFDWDAAIDHAAAGTVLYPGDVVAGPPLDAIDAAGPGRIPVPIAGIGVLDQQVDR